MKFMTADYNSRRLHGRRGLKCGTVFIGADETGRRLHGRRGLKYGGCKVRRKIATVAAFTGGVD